jgi:hypothetical protein
VSKLDDTRARVALRGVHAHTHTATSGSSGASE